MQKASSYYSKFIPIVLILLVALVSVYFLDHIRNISFWTGYIFPWTKLAYVLAPIVVTILARVIAKIMNRNFNLVFGILWILCFILTLAVSKIDGIVSSLLFSIFYFCCLYILGDISLSVFRTKGHSAVLKVLVGSVLFHHILFLLAAGSFLRPDAVYAILCIAFIIFTFEAFKNKNKYTSFIKSYIENESDFIEKLLVSYLVLVFILSFVTISAPQTYADGVVERLPFLKQVLNHSTFPFHYFKWALIMPLPLNLLLAPGYFFSGDLGASTILFFYTLAFLCVLRNFFDFFDVRKKISYASLGLIFSLSPIWLLTVTIYFDIGIVLFCMAGLLIFLRGIDRKSKSSLLLAFFLWGFAISIKTNAAIFVACFLLVFYLFNLKKIKNFIFNSPKIFLVFFVAWIPWAIRSFLITGNPVFPFLSFLNNKEFSNVSILNSEALKAFSFDGGLKRFVSIPWDLVFSTDKFGEYLPGTFNPLMLVLFLFCILCSFVLLRRRRIGKTEIILIVTSLIVIYLTSFVLKATIFRYWLGGYILLWLMLTKIIQTHLDEFSSKIVCMLFYSFVPLSICFHLFFGARLNYGLQYGIGDSIWVGKPKASRYIKDVTYGIPEYLNRKIEKSGKSGKPEAVLLTQYFFANYIESPTVYLADFNSLFGVLTSIDRFSHYISENNVRYWVLNIQVPFEVDPEIRKHHLTEQAIVFASGDFVVYDLLGNRAALTKSYYLKNSGSRELGWMNAFNVPMNIVSSEAPAWLEINSDKSSNFLKIELNINSNVSSAVLIGQIIGYDKNGIEIHRRVVSKVAKNGENEIFFYSDINPDIERLKVQFNPWTLKDGESSFIETSISFFK